MTSVPRLEPRGAPSRGGNWSATESSGGKIGEIAAASERIAAVQSNSITAPSVQAKCFSFLFSNSRLSSVEAAEWWCVSVQARRVRCRGGYICAGQATPRTTPRLLASHQTCSKYYVNLGRNNVATYLGAELCAAKGSECRSEVSVRLGERDKLVSDVLGSLQPIQISWRDLVGGMGSLDRGMGCLDRRRPRLFQCVPHGHPAVEAV